MNFITRTLWSVAGMLDLAVQSALSAFRWAHVRAVVILKAAPTWLTFVALAAPVLADELADVLPAPVSERVTSLLLTVAAVAGALIATIRRLTPVPPEERGILAKNVKDVQ